MKLNIGNWKNVKMKRLMKPQNFPKSENFGSRKSKDFLGNKKADLATTLLVFMAIALVGAASIVFLTSSGEIKRNVVDARFIDDIYLKEEKLDFYLQDIFDKTVENFNIEEGEDKLISNFKEELEKYKVENKFIIPEFSQVEEQINNLKIEENKVKAEFRFELRKETKLFSAIYIYNKKFEKDFIKT